MEEKEIQKEPEVNAENYKEIVDNVRDEYEAKLKEEREARMNDAKKYATSVLNGQTANEPKVEEPKLATSEEAKKVYLGLDEYRTSDVERWTALLNWRDCQLNEGKGDIFCLTKPGQEPSEEAKRSAERTADVIKQCIEDSNYDDSMFKVLIDKRCVDPAILRSLK